ncbi:hypothetical protein ELH75_34035 [Rhizobium leguminosarum]|uniref:Monooxygenase n=1 Tax=Rhizobium leguminosarum TaxID=384 RepID=A0A7M3DTX0_RHILE|nr:hypothetical protein [Rhizobium leguminosarum]TAY52064.1 hypothetical protein ELH90_10540 [Rhizobium leguminosarum]TAZ45907.1 hypothetical protein ELH75_34035 [Rhizobium leguminosarum]
MIAALVLFPVPAGTTMEQIKVAYELSAPRFTGMPGLLSKHYLFDGAGQGGAFYVWSTRADAEALYTEEWRQSLTQRYGAPPTLSIYEVPVAIDNAAASRTFS